MLMAAQNMYVMQCNQAITFHFILNALPNCPCNSLANSGHIVHIVFSIAILIIHYCSASAGH
jgi:hypothetical protein